MEIALNFVEHLNLLSLLIECNREWVSCAEEDLKDLERVPIEAVTLNLAFSIY